MAFTLLYNFPALAADPLTDSFNEMMGAAASTPPGLYKSKTRTAVSFGSYSVRAKTSSINLFSYTPPSVSAGCNGISAHFGGFSFITGAQIQTFIQNISQNAPGLVIQLAIKVGCEPCEAVLAIMEDLAELAAQIALDSCTAAKTLIAGIDSAIDLCGSMAAVAGSTGLTSDAGAATERCRDEVNSYDTYLDLFKKNEDGTTPAVPKKQPCASKTNKAWCIISQAELLPMNITTNRIKNLASITTDEELEKLAFAELLHNMMPMTRNEQNPQHKQLTNEQKKKLLAETTAKQFFELASCGISGSTGSSMSTAINKALEGRCKEFWNGDIKLEIDVCNSAVSDEKVWQDCFESQPMDYKVWVAQRNDLFKKGLNVTIAELLYDAYNRVQTNQTLTTAQVNIISVAPIPLYQLLNLSATYPEIRDESLIPATMLLSDLLAIEFFNSRLAKISSENLTKDLLVEDMKLLRDTLAKFNAGLRGDKVSEYLNTYKSNLHAFRDSMVMTINSYQKQLTNDIATKQLGGNLAATKVIARIK